ncbi:hypothetical protein M6B38_118280 [Iris pallida]|uniref:Uncharacterized protein n=1 Tax=Iris pallida TaxID=29817 RepID=A0AAX6HJE9_IRIPA|nr:hypothetical protein M6B38_118280 [Iris pallida]
MSKPCPHSRLDSLLLRYNFAIWMRGTHRCILDLMKFLGCSCPSIVRVQFWSCPGVCSCPSVCSCPGVIVIKVGLGLKCSSGGRQQFELVSV